MFVWKWKQKCQKDVNFTKAEQDTISALAPEKVCEKFLRDKGYIIVQTALVLYELQSNFTFFYF